MRTRAEIEAELNAKGKENALKIDLNKFNQELDYRLSLFLDQIRQEKVKIDVNHNLEEIREIKALKRSIDNLEIPKEIKINKQINHSTDAVSHNFLWWYFAISSVMIMISICVAVHFYTDADKLAQERENIAYSEGKGRGRADVYYILPQKSKEYIKKAHPEWFQSR